MPIAGRKVGAWHVLAFWLASSAAIPLKKQACWTRTQPPFKKPVTPLLVDMQGRTFAAFPLHHCSDSYQHARSQLRPNICLYKCIHEAHSFQPGAQLTFPVAS